ncbi:unnamed protein product [Adineta steineri]|uniref:Uncharacterized protein n=1 Tax=Adineta steineri TaxID=433720 RepID=A0A815DH77_9BILA|nr:unnamed protein product [Adineta steineri]
MDVSFDKIEKYIRNPRLHNFIQDLSTKIIYNDTIKNNLNKSKIYFIHIPRTASDSLRTHMIGQTGLIYDKSTYHCEQFQDCLLLNNERYKKFQSYYIIKGFYSYNDLAKYKIFDEKSNIFITIFRNPIERILSLYDYSKHGFLFRRPFLTLKQFLTSNDPIIQSFINNSMTWQLGYHLLMSERQHFIEQQNNSDIIYDLAKSHLKLFNYIAFYENLMYDYNELNSKIFSNLNRNHSMLDFLFNIASWFGFFRMRVLKYNARIRYNLEIQNILKQLTFYDMKLYNFAKNDIRHLNFITFDSYFQASFIVLFILFYFIGCIFLLYRLRLKILQNSKINLH